MRKQNVDRGVLSALGDIIRSHRLARGLSQEELSFLSKLDRSYVGGVERGERNVSFVNLVRLSRGLDVALPELLAEFKDWNGQGKRR